MTQGQGEVKVKLNAMNKVAAGCPLTDMGFVRVFCSKYSGVSVTLSLSLTVPFPSFTTKNKSKKILGIFVNSVVDVGWGLDSI